MIFRDLAKSIGDTLLRRSGYRSSTGYCANEVCPLTAIAVADIFFPEITIYNGCLVRKSQFESSDHLDRWIDSTGGDLRSVESVINSLRIYDAFTHNNFDIEESTLLAKLIDRSWSLWIPIVSKQRIESFVDVDDDGPRVTFISRARPLQ